MYQITQNYITYQNTGKSLIFRADLHLIGGCNFKCVMCDNWKREIEMKFTEDDLYKIILKLKNDYNCNYIRFHGQEPTMYSKLEDLIAFSKKLGLKVAIKTNAWLLSDKRLVKILKYGLDELYLSIDGPNAEIHDYIRGVNGSFAKNIDIIKKSKKINPDLKIYINSVVMNYNFETLEQMIDLGKKYDIDRVSFVFLNDKNRKDIDSLNLTKQEFFYFFNEKVKLIYEKAKLYNINVDFSPFISELVGKNNEEVLQKLTDIEKYQGEINSFYEGIYGKYFYDKYGCFGPLDHSSINYTGDMYGCCVVERNTSVSVGNVLQDDISEIKNSPKYEKYRQNSNEKCGYASKCASNFYTRKTLFKEIYLNDELYDKSIAINYYRYLKELFTEDESIINNIKLKKLKEQLLHFYDNLEFYRELLLNNNISKSDIVNINSLDFIEKLPILDKDILKLNYEQIIKLSENKQVLYGKTSGNTGNAFRFVYPLDFKRHIKQIAIFSGESDFTFKDSYFLLTPINCNQKAINNIREPDYVKKIYISISDFYFDKEYFIKIQKLFIDNKNTKYLHADAKYLLYLILGFHKFDLELPKLKAISLTYTYTNKSLKEFIKQVFDCNVLDNYGCSEVGPISIDIDSNKKLYGDNIIFEELNGEFVVTDLDNPYFPFIRYKNDDLGKYDGNNIIINGKKNQLLNSKSLRDLDDFFSEYFSEILFYQFDENKLFYFSFNNIDNVLLKTKLNQFLGIDFEAIKIGENEFFELGDCSKFKTII
ncbi:MAG: radical SAM protein [Candidatus Gracilibacteria bacterium]|nr:radical SAM protein [Candidatus Gracilibacteria bacterium]